MGDPGFDFETAREYGLSHSDFFRIFPRVRPDWKEVGPRCVEVEGSGDRRLQIEISPEHVRKLATLRIPYIDITFRFRGWSAEQRTEFFEHFDRAFQKGGG